MSRRPIITTRAARAALVRSAWALVALAAGTVAWSILLIVSLKLASILMRYPSP